MAINSLQTNISQTPKRAGKHKIPRYLYHFTDGRSLEDIKQTGVVKGFSSTYFNEDKGIFTVELANFLKHWKDNELWQDWARTLQEALLLRICLRSLQRYTSICAIKIPTRRIDEENIKVRSQNILFCEPSVLDCDTLKKYKFHSMFGESAKKSSLYEQKKHAIEYILTQNIPIEDVVLTGTVSENEIVEALKKRKEIKDPLKSSDYFTKTILEKLFSGKSEKKAVESNEWLV